MPQDRSAAAARSSRSARRNAASERQRMLRAGADRNASHDQRQRAGDRRRPRRAGHAERGQAEPAADQQRRQRSGRSMVDNANASSGVSVSPTPRIIAVDQQEDEAERHRDQHDRAHRRWPASRMSGGVASAIINCRLNRPPNSATASREQQADRQRRAGNRLDLVGLARAPGLADQDGCAGAQAHDEGEQEEHHGEEHRNRRQRIDPDHLAEHRRCLWCRTAIAGCCSASAARGSEECLPREGFWTRRLFPLKT